jgi:putative flippase GtrA
MISVKTRTDELDGERQAKTPGLVERMRSKEVVRFLRYCVVGASSFALGFAIFNFFFWLTRRVFISGSLSFALSVVNGFVWNRKWTFSDKRGRPAWEQALKFAVVNVVGYALNMTVTVLLLALWSAHGVLAGHVVHHAAMAILGGRTREDFTFLQVNAVGVVATAVVVMWNYLANKLWSFRH